MTKDFVIYHSTTKEDSVVNAYQWQAFSVLQDIICLGEETNALLFNKIDLSQKKRRIGSRERESAFDCVLAVVFRPTQLTEASVSNWKGSTDTSVRIGRQALPPVSWTFQSHLVSSKALLQEAIHTLNIQ